MKKLILIDGNAIIHRAFHSMPPFRTSKGVLVNAVYGFGSMLLTIMNTEKPDFIIVSFDMKGKTFRHVEYKEYKATRKKAPDELYEQIPLIKKMVEIFQIPIYETPGFEADDVLGTLSKQAEERPDLHTYIVTADRDALQLVSEKTRVISPVRGFVETQIFDHQAVVDKYGLLPSQIPDMKGLEGDSSDNIKGVAGVGKKTAKTLLQKYGSIENIYENLEEITGKVKERLENDKDSAFFSKMLATIVRDVPMDLDLDAAKSHDYDHQKITDFLLEHEFKSLLGKFKMMNNHYSEKQNIEKDIQPSLF